MAIEAHLETLVLRHQELKSQISDELKNPSCDVARVQDLKRRKLKIKDTIYWLKQRAD